MTLLQSWNTSLFPFPSPEQTQKRMNMVKPKHVENLIDCSLKSTKLYTYIKALRYLSN